MATYDPVSKSWVLPPAWDTTTQLADQGPPPTGIAQGAQINSAPAAALYVPQYAGIVASSEESTIGQDPAVNSEINCFVTSNVGVLTVSDASATYNITISQNQNQSQESLAYDNIFDITLTSAESIKFLNGFTVSGLNLNLPENNLDQLSGTATCNFNTNDVVDAVLQKVLTDATDASGNTPADFLGITLNQLLTNYTVSSFRDAFLATINSVADLNQADLVVNIDQGSGTVVLDVSASSQSVANVCYNGQSTEKLINQIDIPHLNAYADPSNNTIKTIAFPAIPGDTFVFGLKSTAPEVNFHYNKATSDASNDGAANNSESLDLAWQSVQGNEGYHVYDSAWTLAFRMKMGGTGTTYPVSTSGAANFTALLPTSEWSAYGGAQ